MFLYCCIFSRFQLLTITAKIFVALVLHLLVWMFFRLGVNFVSLSTALPVPGGKVLPDLAL